MALKSGPPGPAWPQVRPKVWPERCNMVPSRPHDTWHGAQAGPKRADMAPKLASRVQHDSLVFVFAFLFAWHFNHWAHFCCSQVWHFSHMAFELAPRGPPWPPSWPPGSGKRSSIAPSWAAEVQHGPRCRPQHNHGARVGPKRSDMTPKLAPRAQQDFSVHVFVFGFA